MSGPSASSAAESHARSSWGWARIVILLTLGAAASVLIAWTQPVWTRWVGHSSRNEPTVKSWPREFAGPHGPPTSMTVYRSPGSSGLVAMRDESAEVTGSEALIWTYVRHTKGVPFHCVGCEMWGAFSPRQTASSGGSLYTASPMFHVSGYTYCPVPEALRPMLHENQFELLYRPQWLGLLGDTLVWGAAIGVLARVPVWVRAQVRRRRSLCTGCGYAVADAGRCPECGTPRS